jgi:predicted metal-dependent peptidase
MQNADVNQKISKAKTKLIIRQPFFATLILGMQIVEDASIPTMATNGQYIKYNPDWTNRLSEDEIMFVLAHETMHVVYLHMFRRGNRTPQRWNQAADYVINDMLVKENCGTMPVGGLLNPQLVANGGGTAEGVYKLIPEENEEKQPGDDGGAMDNLEQPGTDAAQIASQESMARVKIAQARNAAKMQGKLSGDLERLIKEMLRVDADWREVLRHFFTEKAQTNLTYARPKRRFLYDDLILPSYTGEKLGYIAIAVDCSGSVDDEQLALFEGEIKAIIEDTNPEMVKVIYFDQKVQRVEQFNVSEGEAFKLKAKGGGGTAFSPIFKFINEDDAQPIGCVVLTDLDCDDFGPAPDYPVLWASIKHNNNPVPFGDVTYVKPK